MRLFQWLADLFAGSSDPPRASSDEGVSINPATGLPMTGPGIGASMSAAIPSARIWTTGTTTMPITAMIIMRLGRPAAGSILGRCFSADLVCPTPSF